MKFKFQSFVDLQTSATSMQVIQWSVGGVEVVNRCRHLFGAYKYFKLGKISVKLVPASTLPVDPLGLSYGDSDPQTVDPRDQMNPGLVRITNGEDIFTNVSALDADRQVKIYNAMMLDPRWSKFMLQSGFRRSAYPLYWQIGQIHQDKYPGATNNIPGVVSSATVTSHGVTVGCFDQWNDTAGAHAQIHDYGSHARGLFQVGHRGKLGFLPTDYFQEIYDGSGNLHNSYGVNNVPEVSVITCVLPKAYKTIYYYRCYITEEVIFSGLRSTPAVEHDGCQYSGLDNFLIGTYISRNPQTTGTSAVGTNELMNNGDEMP